MAQNNILPNFTNYFIPNEECAEVKGGRANTPINTGSFGFIDWGDVEIRNNGVIVTTISSALETDLRTRG